MRYGHFDNEHREYVIEKVDLPTSWTNYLGVENLAVVVKDILSIRVRNITESHVSMETVFQWTGRDIMYTSVITRKKKTEPMTILVFPGSRSQKI